MVTEVKLDKETLSRLEAGEFLYLEKGKLFTSPRRKLVKIYITEQYMTADQLCEIAEKIKALELQAMYCIGKAVPVTISEEHPDVQRLRERFAQG